MIAATYQGVIELNKNATFEMIPFFARQQRLWLDVKNGWLRIGDFQSANKADDVVKAYRDLIIRLATKGGAKI